MSSSVLKVFLVLISLNPGVLSSAVFKSPSSETPGIEAAPVPAVFEPDPGSAGGTSDQLGGSQQLGVLGLHPGRRVAGSLGAARSRLPPASFTNFANC